MFKSKDIIVVVNKDKVEKYLMPDAYKGYPVSIPNWLTAFDGILDAEIQISGLSANDPNPLHQPMSNGVKYLMTQVGTGYMYATDWGTGFNVMKLLWTAYLWKTTSSIMAGNIP